MNPKDILNVFEDFFKEKELTVEEWAKIFIEYLSEKRNVAALIIPELNILNKSIIIWPSHDYEYYPGARYLVEETFWFQDVKIMACLFYFDQDKRYLTGEFYVANVEKISPDLNYTEEAIRTKAQEYIDENKFILIDKHKGEDPWRKIREAENLQALRR